MSAERIEDALGYVFVYADPTFLLAQPERAEAEPFTRVDIFHVIAASVTDGPDGCADENLRALVVLNDGQYAAMDGGCDTTGWDCQSWCDIRIGRNLADVIAYGFDDDGRRVLGLPAGSGAQ